MADDAQLTAGVDEIGSQTDGGHGARVERFLRKFRNLPRLVVIFALCAVLGMWALVGANVLTERETALDRTRIDAANLSAAFEERVTDFFATINQAMDLVQRDWLRDGSNIDLKTPLARYPDIASSVVQIGIIGADGKLLQTSLDPHAEHIDLSDREHIRVPLDHPNQGLFIGKPVIGRVSHQVTIQVTRTLKAADGSVAGVILISINPNFLAGLNNKIDLGRTGVVVLAGTDGVIRARFTKEGDNTPSLDKNLQISNPHVLKDTDATAHGAYEAESKVDTVLRLVDWRRIDQYHLTVFVGLGEAEALSFAKRQTTMIALAASFVTVIIAGFAILLRIKMIRAIRRERMLADERLKLRRAQTHLARAQQIAAVGSAENDLVTGETYWSDEMYRIYGVDSRSFTPTIETVEALIHPDDRAEVFGALRACARGSSCPTAQYRIIRPDGEIRILHRETEIIFDDDGAPIRAISAVKDVTDNLLSEQLLEEQSNRLRSSQEHLKHAQRIAGLGTITRDLRSGRIEWSPEVYRILSIDETIPPDKELFRSLIHVEDLAKIDDAAIKGEQGLDDPPFEYRIWRPNGEMRIIHREADVIRDDRGLPSHRITTMMDVTEARLTTSRLRESAEKLAQSEQLLAHAQRIAKIGSFVHDLCTGTMEWSDTVYQIFGVTRDNFVPSVKKVREFIHPEDRAHFADIRAKPNENETRLISEQRIVRPDGTVRITRVERETIVDGDGMPISVVGTIQDVTELRASEAREKQLEHELLHSQKLEALGTLAGGVAHDLNNTLVPILALSQLVLEDIPRDSSQREDLETVVVASKRARDLVKQILAFSRKEELVKAEVDLAALIREALHMLRAAVPATIDIVDEIAEVPRFLGDAGQLHQVIVNLVTNAAQAIGDQIGRITVSLTIAEDGRGAPPDESKGSICLSIADTGCGMEAETIERIFEPFFTTKEVGTGTGLGLSVVHGIVTSHGGRIVVQSEPGRGTEFRIIIPIASAEMNAYTEQAA